MSNGYDLLTDPALQSPPPVSEVRPLSREEELIHLLAQTEVGRESLISSLWASIPQWQIEHQYQASGTTVSPPAQTRNLFKITSIIATVPSGSTGTLTLGNITIPLVSGNNPMGPLCIILNPSDVRNLTITPAGTLALILMGEQLPLYGKIR